MVLGRIGAIGREVVGKDLIDTEHDVSKEKRRFDGTAAATANAVCAEEHSRGHGDANKSGINIADLRELGNAPQEIDGASNDGAGKCKQDNLRKKKKKKRVKLAMTTMI